LGEQSQGQKTADNWKAKVYQSDQEELTYKKTWIVLLKVKMGTPYPVF
jgi:hypothetical protein